MSDNNDNPNTASVEGSDQSATEQHNNINTTQEVDIFQEMAIEALAAMGRVLYHRAKNPQTTCPPTVEPVAVEQTEKDD